MSPLVHLTFDVLILAALGITIFYCWRLSKQFNQMRADRKAFETLIGGLNTAASRADASIRAFKETAVGSGDILQDKISRARALCEELEIMIQAGDSLANRLAERSHKSVSGDNNQSSDAGSGAGLASPRSAAETSSGAGIAPRTRAEKELLEAMKAKQT